MNETPLFKKLNFKQHKEILILNHPTEFKPAVDAISAFTIVKTDLESIDAIEFVLTFIHKKEQINYYATLINKNLINDCHVWFAYPKKTSKKYKSDINRDIGWEELGELDFEGVRQVSIDDDWSAIRFRKVSFIKTMKRNSDFAMTEKGKLKTLSSNLKRSLKK